MDATSLIIKKVSLEASQLGKGTWGVNEPQMCVSCVHQQKTWQKISRKTVGLSSTHPWHLLRKITSHANVLLAYLVSVLTGKAVLKSKQNQNKQNHST